MSNFKEELAKIDAELLVLEDSYKAIETLALADGQVDPEERAQLDALKATIDAALAERRKLIADRADAEDASAAESARAETLEARDETWDPVQADVAYVATELGASPGGGQSTLENAGMTDTSAQGKDYSESIYEEGSDGSRSGRSVTRFGYEETPPAPISSIESYESFSEAQRGFLESQGIDAASVPPASADKLADLMEKSRRAAEAMAGGNLEDLDLGEDVALTLNTLEGDEAAEIEVMIVDGDSQILMKRRLDYETGEIVNEFVFQDPDVRLESEQAHEFEPRVLRPISIEVPYDTSGEVADAFGDYPYEDPEAEREQSDEDDLDAALEDLDTITGSGGAGSAPSDEGVGSFFEGAIYGDFGGNDSYSAIAGQTVVGFVPIAGQIADVRDLSAAIRDVGQGKSGAWMSVGIAAVGFIPGLDFLKGGSRVGRRALQEGAEEATEGVVAASLKRMRRVLSKEAAAKAKKSLKELGAARREMLQRFDDLADNPGVSETARSAIKSARNGMEDHLQPSDLSGALRDKLGIPVRKPGSGEAWNHLEEVESAMNGLSNARTAMVDQIEHLKRYDPDNPLVKTLSDELDNITEVQRRINEFLEIK